MPGSATDAWRLSLGTLTALPTRAPAAVDRRTAALAMVLAPMAVMPLAATVIAISATGLPTLVKAVLAVAAVIVLNRAFHLDGLSDTVDGLAASHDRERSLTVMKSGTAGPAGVVALVLVVLLQVVSAAYLLEGWRGGVLVGAAVMASRLALPTACVRGLPSARPDGLGGIFASTIPAVVVVVLWTLAAVGLSAAAHLAGLAWWRGAVAAIVGLAVVGALLAHARRRLGGVTGDVMGAGVELAFAAILASLLTNGAWA